jgi:hypothetical protein
VNQIPTWGHKLISWDAAKTEAKTELEQVARAKKPPVTYGDLSRKVRSIAFEPDGHDFHGLLGQLSVESEQEGKGLISALVVRVEDGRPGRGFFTLALELGRDISDRDRLWSEEADRVYRSF